MAKASLKAVSGIFDAKTGQLSAGDIPEGYGKSQKNVSEWLDDSGPININNASGKPNVDGNGNLLIVETDDYGAVNMYWTSASYNRVYVDAVKPYKSETLQTLHGMSNEERTKADQKTLRGLGEAILKQGWTKKQLETIMGIEFSGSDNSCIRIADYYQLKTGQNFNDSDYGSAGFRIVSNNDVLLDMLEDMGFDSGKVIEKKKTSNGKTDATYNNSLFYSDELATNNFSGYTIDKTKRVILIENIKVDNVTKKITQMTIYSKAMDNQANMDENQKKNFRITVKLSDLEH